MKKDDYALGPSAAYDTNCSECGLEYGTPFLNFWVTREQKIVCSNCNCQKLVDWVVELLPYKISNEKVEKIIKEWKPKTIDAKKIIKDLDKKFRKELNK